MSNSCSGESTVPPVPPELSRQLGNLRKMLTIIEELSRDELGVLPVYATALEQTIFPKFVDLLRNLPKSITGNTQSFEE